MPKHKPVYFLLSLRESIKGFQFLFNVFDNWHEFVLLWFGLKNEITLVCSGRRNNLKTIYINKRAGRIRLLYKEKPLLFWFGSKRQLANAMRNIYQNFILEQYGSLDVRTRLVVDIGANNGDSAMYFIINGASKVFAYEPYPYAFDQADRNIKLNGMKKKIELMEEAVGERSGTITLDAGYKSVSNSMLERSIRGKRIRVTTLDNIVKEYGLRKAVLKIDCEGGEYGILSNTSDASISCFDQIAIEYHFGYEGLVKRLREAGFKVRYTQPRAARNAETNGLKMVYGMIYARR